MCECPLSIVVWGVGCESPLSIVVCVGGVSGINCGVGCRWCECPLSIVVWGVGGVNGHHQLWCGV